MTQAAIGILSGLVQAAASRHSNDSDTPRTSGPPAPAIVTVAEFPADAELAGEAMAQMEVKEGDKTFAVEAPVYFTSTSNEDKCCEFTSITVANVWQTPVEARVAGAGNKKLSPGMTATFSGNLGRCVRLTVLGPGDQKLAEDVNICCDDLAAGRGKSLYGLQIVNYSYQEVECGEGAKAGAGAGAAATPSGKTPSGTTTTPSGTPGGTATTPSGTPSGQTTTGTPSSTPSGDSGKTSGGTSTPPSGTPSGQTSTGTSTTPSGSTSTPSGDSGQTPPGTTPHPTTQEKPPSTHPTTQEKKPDGTPPDEPPIQGEDWTPTFYGTEVKPECLCAYDSWWDEETRPQAGWVYPEGQTVIRVGEVMGAKVMAWDFDVLAKACTTQGIAKSAVKALLMEDQLEYQWTVTGAKVLEGSDTPAVLFQANKDPGMVSIQVEIKDKGEKIKDKGGTKKLQKQIAVVPIDGVRIEGSSAAPALKAQKDAQKAAIEKKIAEEEARHQADQCKLELEWLKDEGLKLYFKHGVRSPKHTLCADDITLVKAKGSNVDVLKSTCGVEGTVCSEEKESLYDPAMYHWVPTGGQCLGGDEGAATPLKAPPLGQPATAVNLVMTDTGLQKIDDPLQGQDTFKICEIKDRYIEVEGKNRGKKANICIGNAATFKAVTLPDDGDCHKEVRWYLKDKSSGDILATHEGKDFSYKPTRVGRYEAVGRCGCCQEDKLQLVTCMVGSIEAEYLGETQFGRKVQICPDTEVNFKVTTPDIPECQRLKWTISKDTKKVHEAKGLTLRYPFREIGRYKVSVELDDPDVKSCGSEAEVEVGVLNLDQIERHLCLDEEEHVVGVDVEGPGRGTAGWKIEYEVADDRLAAVAGDSGVFAKTASRVTNASGKANFQYQPRRRSRANDDVSATVRIMSENGQTLCSKDLQLTHHQVTSLTFQGQDNNLQGDKVFPDAQQLGDPRWHDKVFVNGVVSPVPPRPKKIYFGGFDVDDASSDPDVDLNGRRGADNNGRPQEGKMTREFVMTKPGTGAVMNEFEVTHQPGDNFVVAASCSARRMRQMRVHDFDGRTLVYDLAEVVRPEQVSSLLTVWRKLHVERDSMGPAESKKITGTVKSITPAGAFTEIELDRNFTDDENEDKDNYFEYGTLTIGAVNFQVNSSTSMPWIYNDRVVVKGRVPVEMAGMPYALKEDDDYSLLPHTVVGALLQSAIKDAFVEVVFEDSLNQNNVPFQTQLAPFFMSPDDVRAAVGPNRQMRPSENYWGVTLLAAFEGGSEQERDPESDSWLAGIADSLTGNYNAVVIFLEVIRENSRGRKMPFVNFEDMVVAHEAGHTQNGKHEHGEIMADGSTNTLRSRKYHGKTIRALREDPAP